MTPAPVALKDPDRPRAGVPLLQMGFRPFFLGAGVMAVTWMALWLLALRGLEVRSHYGPYYWHAHEMIFGYTVAVIAGFLLTAVANWTGVPTPRGPLLGALFGLWCAGRLLPFFPSVVPGWAIVVVDLAFLPALAVGLSASLYRGRDAGNWVFVLILGLLAVANGMVHAEVLGLAEGTARKGTEMGLAVVVFTIAIIGGRVIPMFTARVPGVRPRSHPAVEAVALGSMLLFILAVQARPGSGFAGATAAVAAVSHGVRLALWHDPRVWRAPLVWVLHLGYGWIVAGFALWSVAAFAGMPYVLAVHAFTVGGIGVLTMGMMARVALGHTDRPLEPSRAVAAAFVLVNLAAVARVLAPVAAPEWYAREVVASGALWIMAFVLFLSVYAPILMSQNARSGP